MTGVHSICEFMNWWCDAVEVFFPDAGLPSKNFEQRNFPDILANPIMKGQALD